MPSCVHVKLKVQYVSGVEVCARRRAGGASTRRSASDVMCNLKVFDVVRVDEV